jgi:hypothetical protein
MEINMRNDNLRPLVDALGNLKAEMAALAERERNIKAQLIQAGVDELEGDLFRCTISKSERESLNMEAVREKLSPQFIRCHTKTVPVTTVRVVARTQAPKRLALVKGGKESKMAELKASPGCCEEASTLSREHYIPCNRPATNMVGWPHRNEGPYRMCDMCTDHSVRNRGAVIVGEFRAERVS